VHLLKLDFGYEPGWVVASSYKYALACPGDGDIKQASLTFQLVAQWIFEKALLGIVDVNGCTFEIW
jgi:hypothetical protein